MTRTEKTALGETYWKVGSGHADAGRLTEAITSYRRGAELGCLEAQNNLGVLLLDKVRPPETDEAVHWLKRAARRGHREAAYNLALHYRDQGRDRWRTHWLRAAAKLGHPEAAAAL